MAKGHKGGHAPGKGHDHEEHEEHVNHEAWVIPYADMLTLLMALFLVLFAIGRVDTEKFKKLAESLHQSLGGSGGSKPAEVVDLQPVTAREAGVVGSGGILMQLEVLTERAAGEKALDEKRTREGEVKSETGVLLKLKDELTGVAVKGGFSDQLGFQLEARGLVVIITTDKVLFKAGQAELEPEGKVLLDAVIGQIKASKHRISIEGHTDSRPISTSKFPSNWELSTARATTVLRYLVEQHGFDPKLLSAAGFADTRPLVEGDSPLAQTRNRRVEIVILSDLALDDTGSSGTTGSTNGQLQADIKP